MIIIQQVLSMFFDQLINMNHSPLYLDVLYGYNHSKGSYCTTHMQAINEF